MIPKSGNRFSDKIMRKTNRGLDMKTTTTLTFRAASFAGALMALAWMPVAQAGQAAPAATHPTPSLGVVDTDLLLRDSLAAKGVLMVALSHPADRSLTRAELLERGHEARWQVDAALAELVETRWLAPIGEGRFALCEDLDDPDQNQDDGR